MRLKNPATSGPDSAKKVCKITRGRCRWLTYYQIRDNFIYGGIVAGEFVPGDIDHMSRIATLREARAWIRNFGLVGKVYVICKCKTLEFVSVSSKTKARI